MSATALRRAHARLPAWAAPAAVGAVALVGCATVALLDPETRGRLSPGCPFRTATGLDCPGCGATRALYALTRGDVGLALDHNVLVVLLLPLLAWAWTAWLRFRIGRRRGPPALAPTVGYALAGAIGLFWVLRNLPLAPLAWLGSTAG